MTPGPVDGAERRRIRRGTRWLVLRAWERCDDDQRALRTLFSYNWRLARAYQLVEEMREVLHAPDGDSMRKGLMRILRRTEERENAGKAAIGYSFVLLRPGS